MTERFQRFFRFALVALVVVSMTGVSLTGRPDARAQAAPPTAASYIPDDVLFFVSIDLHVLSSQWLQAAILARRIDQAWTPERIVGAVIDPAFDSELPIDPTPFIGGQIAIAVGGISTAAADADAADGGDLVDPGALASGTVDRTLLILLAPDVEAAEAEVLGALAAQAEERGVAVQSVTHNGTEIRYLAGDATTATPGVAVTRIDDAIALATTPAELMRVIDVRSGAAGSIADLPELADALAMLPAEHLAAGAINGPALLADPEGAAGFGAAGEALIPGGGAALTAFTVRSQSDGFRLDSRTVGIDGAPVRGFGEHFDPELLERLPAEAQIAVSGYDFAATRILDGVVAFLFGALFGALGEMFVPADPAASPVADAPANLDEAAAEAYETLALLLGLDLQTEFVELLDGEFLFGLWDASGGLSGASAAFVSQTSDPETVDATLGQIVLLVGLFTGSVSMTPDIDPATGLMRIGAGDVSGLALGVVNDEVIVSVGAGGEAVLGDGEARLVDSELFIAVTGDLPEERSLLIFIDIGSLQAEPATRFPIPGPFGSGRSSGSGLAFGLAAFQDGDVLGMQGLLYIPEP